MVSWYQDEILNDEFSSQNQLLEPSSDESSQQSSTNISIISKLQQESSFSQESYSEYLSVDLALLPQDFVTSPMDFRRIFLGELTLVMVLHDIRQWYMRWFSLRYFLRYFVFDYTREKENGGLWMDSTLSSSPIFSIDSLSDSSSHIRTSGSDSPPTNSSQYRWSYMEDGWY